MNQIGFTHVSLLLGLKSQASFSFILSFFFFLKVDREDEEIQHEDESLESDEEEEELENEEEEELENEEESLFDKSKCYLRVTSTKNCRVAQNRTEYEK